MRQALALVYEEWIRQSSDVKDNLLYLIGICRSFLADAENRLALEKFIKLI